MKTYDVTITETRQMTVPIEAESLAEAEQMQSSESGYNTRYPREPNGITDPEYSIECGVQAIKDCLQSAGVENPVDMEHIRLALQGYNFGNG